LSKNSWRVTISSCKCECPPWVQQRRSALITATDKCLLYDLGASLYLPRNCPCQSGQPSELYPAPSRDAILDAAERLFADSGFDGTSMRSIAEAAGVAQGLLHYHFGTKERLFAENVHKAFQHRSQRDSPVPHQFPPSRARCASTRR